MFDKNKWQRDYARKKKALGLCRQCYLPALIVSERTLTFCQYHNTLHKKHLTVSEFKEMNL